MSKESRRLTVRRARREQDRARRRAWLAIGGGTAAAAALAVAVPLAATAEGSTGGGHGHGRKGGLAPLSGLGPLRPASAPGKPGPEGVPVPAAPPLAGTKTIATGRKVDGISCDTSEKLLYHVHAHLTIVVNGKPRQVPAGIGIPGGVAERTPGGPFTGGGTCFYWLHTHAPDGVIHIESPTRRTYTLGDFFDEWGQPLGPDRAGPAKGRVTALDNGQVWTGNPRDIPLTRHAQIQIEVGTPLTAPEKITFTNGL